jgi:hypothetical protein
MRFSAVALATLSLAAFPDLGAQAVYNARAGQTTIASPKLSTMVRVDGSLDEPVWGEAARLTGFSQYRPVDGRAADDSTEILVFYAADAIFFGVRAFEAHGNVVRATLADRDNIGADDRIQILLDTYNDNRRALLFSVNPLGVQQDGVQSEGFDPSQSAGGRFEGVVDISPDFLYESRGRVTEWGYEVELRIPFKSLRYQSADPQTWGLQIMRFTQHSGYEDTWTPAVRANASFLIQSGRLTGLAGLRHGLVMDLNPEFTSSVAGAPRNTEWDYSQPKSELGGNLRWGINPNITLNATINPDFSQVESDVGQVTVNERFALFFPEKRPFFLEALEQYDTPQRLIYTRQIHDPLAGVKLTGKLGATAIAYLGAADDERFSATGNETPIFNVLRVRRDLGASSTLGLVHTDRIEGARYNRVTGADARVVWRKIWFSDAQIVGSWTGDDSGRETGTLWNVTLADRTGRSYGNHYEIGGITQNFQAQSGFVPRTGIITASAFNRFSWYGKPGSLVEQLNSFTGIRPLWLYDEFPKRTLEGGISTSWIASLRGGWRANADISNSHQRFEQETYAGYYVQSRRYPEMYSMIPPRGLYNLWGFSAGINSPNRALSWSLQAGRRGAVLFAEAAEGYEMFASGSVNWRPTASARFEGSLVRRQLNRTRDDSRFSTATIPRLKAEYQLSRAIFLRYIGQYVAQDRTALQDALSGDILIPTQQGIDAFGNPDAVTTIDFRQDILFSYKPSTGTVFFLGYGASMFEPTAFAFDRNTLNRVSDGFFLKASYNYRL